MTTKLRRALFVAGTGAAALLIFATLTILFIPDRVIEGIVTRAAESRGITLHAASLGKAFPIGLTARRLEIDDERGPLFKADSATVRLAILPLFTGNLELTCRARLAGGDLRGTVSRAGDADLEASNIRLQELPFFATATGATVKGVAHLTVHLRRLNKAPSGEVQLAVSDADLSGVKIGGMPLPDSSYPTVQGMLRLAGSRASLESFSLQGEGLYVRLKGDVTLTAPLAASPLNLTLEILPKPEFMDRQKFVFLLLARYMLSPGNYQIPIRGTLGHPAIS